jgi:hypothetical protein
LKRWQPGAEPTAVQWSDLLILNYGQDEKSAYTADNYKNTLTLKR